MARYDPLREHLQTLDRDRDHTFTFSQIERVLGFRLPPSARTHHAWWANQSKGNHSQARAWHAAGWNTKEPDLKSGEVTFTPKLGRFVPSTETIRRLTIAEAKAGLAANYGVPVEAVEVTIRG